MNEYSWIDLIGIVTPAVAIISLIVAVRQLRRHLQQMHRQYEALYVRRYWTIMDKLSAQYRLDGRVTPLDRLLVEDYLQLCEDQIDYRKLGRVTDDTWLYWGSSIRAQVGESPYAEVLAASDGNRFPSLKVFLAREVDYDPLLSKESEKIRLGIAQQATPLISWKRIKN